MDKKFFKYLDKNGKNILNLKKPFLQKAIFKSCLLKKKVIEKDENEKNMRQILNFGHTFAHAFEATKKYSKRLNHGEAVLLGIICASKFAYQNRIIKKNDYLNINNIEQILKNNDMKLIKESCILFGYKGKKIKTRTINQSKMVLEMKKK